MTLTHTDATTDHDHGLERHMTPAAGDAAMAMLRMPSDAVEPRPMGSQARPGSQGGIR